MRWRDGGWNGPDRWGCIAGQGTEIGASQLDPIAYASKIDSGSQGILLREWLNRVVRSIVCGGRAERLDPRPTDRTALQEWISAKVWSYHHPVGACAMGAIVNERCRVLGVDGLSVVDASVMPDIPSANTNIPTIMIERFAQLRRR